MCTGCGIAFLRPFKIDALTKMDVGLMVKAQTPLNMRKVIK